MSEGDNPTLAEKLRKFDRGKTKLFRENFWSISEYWLLIHCYKLKQFTEIDSF